MSGKDSKGEYWTGTRGTLARLLLAASVGIGLPSLLAAQTVQGASGQSQEAVREAADRQDGKGTIDEAELLEKSREAGLLTDWHLEGRYGRGGQQEMARQFAPEKLAAKQAGNQSPQRFVRRRYELVFPEGTFTLPPELSGQRGVFYASSSTYLISGGEFNVYLESCAEAAVFVDGRPVLRRGLNATGVLRGKIRMESGYHSVMVKFVAGAAPFRVAILPPNSGSRRKNNTPYLQAVPTSEDMLAQVAATARGQAGGF
jgi:hypothetical protein